MNKHLNIANKLKFRIRLGDKQRVPGVPLWGSPQQGRCGLGSMDGFTPTPQGHTR